MTSLLLVFVSGMGAGFGLRGIVEALRVIRQRRKNGWSLQAGLTFTDGPLAGSSLIVSYGPEWKDEAIDLPSQGAYLIDWTNVRLPTARWVPA